MLLRKALQECKACRIKRPECSDDPPPCFPKVECRDTNDGPVCGPCPQGLYTIATFTKDQSHDHLPLYVLHGFKLVCRIIFGSIISKFSYFF